ncbi:EF-hand calcium-binding domain-containing protein 6-like [Hydractinia symbiolongicarpus]|uniref:EF-hand calcium-binding domain-containing protein 6-like n=1 Tax=Hydractinia symbiolongicarpus TaxID=13093 RepID=UPI002550D0A9|nr:EF-hand calcium-binding domain-containing protein 6-like [Hydractinia symbiolongicarpus]
MVVKTPWQFGERTFNEPNSGAVFPKLKVEHPLSRLSHPDKLSLRGVSRIGSLKSERTTRNDKETNTRFSSMALPNIPENIKVTVAEDRSKVHMPIFGSGASLSNRIDSRLSATSTTILHESNGSRSMSTIELESILRNKMKTGYFSAKNLFISYDPEGRGDVKREALHRILCTFLAMKLSFSQFNRLMKRLGFENAKTVAFDDFYLLFKKSNLKESSEYPSWFGKEDTSRDSYTANEVHTQLKIAASKSFNNLLDLLDLDEEETIIKPIFRDQLQKIGYVMTPTEYEKLWRKYDSHNTGVIDTNKLSDKLLPTRSTSVNSRQARRSCTSNMQSQRQSSITIEKWLSKKFRGGIHDMHYAFKEFEVDDTVTREEFLLVLRDYGLVLNDDTLDLFLQRCDVPVGSRIQYKAFMKMFQTKCSDSKINKITGDRPMRQYEQSIKSNISSIEECLLDMFQGDLIRLKNKFRKIDQSNSECISDIEFRAAIESFFNVSLKDGDFQEFMKSVPVNDDNKVRYLQFLESFDNKNSKTIFDSSSSVDEREISNITRCGSRTSTASRVDLHKERNVQEIYFAVKSVLKQRFEEVERIFYDIDVKNTKRMTQEMLQHLLRRVGIKLSETETRKLWDTLITDQRGTVEFTYFARHFAYSLKSAAFPNAKTRPPVKGDVDFRMQSNHLNSSRDLIRNYVKTSLEANYTKLMEKFFETDHNKPGYVSADEFKNILQTVSCEITSKEVEILAERFSKDNKIRWQEFIKHLKPNKLISRTGNNMREIMKHPQLDVRLSSISENPEKGLPMISSQIREKVMSAKWKDIRRLFKQYDRTSQGYLSITEFKNILKLCDIVLDENDMYYLISKLDKNLQGRVNFEEVQSIFSNH